jgi:hypothetical protein
MANIKRAAVIADNDDPGVRGANMLVEHLGIPTAIIILPCKDLRDFIKFGGDDQLMQSYLESSIWKTL